MKLSFTKEYYPDLDAISDADMAASRAEVVSILQERFPGVDLSPGTVTGDLVVSPLAAYRAASKEARGRLMSDLDLSNVAGGLIYSCDFVKAYLGNFGVYDVENLRATGLVRLTFDSPNAVQLNKAIRFRFGNTDDYSLRVSGGDVTEIRLLAAGSSHDGAADTYVLSQTSAVTWAVDLPVEGALTAPVARGTAGTATEIPSALVGIVAAADFLPGLPPASLPDLAKMARRISHSLSASSRASATALVLRNWPETAMVSPVITGDQEMQRSIFGAPMMLQRPAMDVYLRSARDMQAETQVVRLDYVLPEGAVTKVFRGKLSLLHRPSRITSLEWSGATNTSLVTSYEVFTRSSRDDVLGSLYCGSRYEDLYVELVPVVDGQGTPLIPLTDGENGAQYALFSIGYSADPLLNTVAGVLESPSYAPAGVDVLVRSGPLVLLDELSITYSKQLGVRTTLTVAREKISDYLDQAGYPEPFRQTEIHDIMRDSGASRVTKIECSGNILVTPATKRLLRTLEDPGTAGLTGEWSAHEVDVDPIAVTDIDDVVQFTIVDQEISPPGGILELWAATERTLRYHVDPEDIQFFEI